MHITLAEAKAHTSTAPRGTAFLPDPGRVGSSIGFEKGVTEWRRFLKPGDLLVASEITWLTDARPAEIQKHWDDEYPEINLYETYKTHFWYGVYLGRALK